MDPDSLKLVPVWYPRRWSPAGPAQRRDVAELLQAESDLREHAGELTAPTLVVWGTRDRIRPVSEGRDLAELIPGAELITLETGHVPFLTEPTALSPRSRRSSPPTFPSRPGNSTVVGCRAVGLKLSLGQSLGPATDLAIKAQLLGSAEDPKTDSG